MDFTHSSDIYTDDFEQVSVRSKPNGQMHFQSEQLTYYKNTRTMSMTSFWCFYC